ncbi:imelysin family protein [Roseivirga sp. BDSF3-8]|uniref:imelysin family protein n=1 Tax=Roseivirga sp. BDSF3-8 TaxID=3241598 RepID=UPI00353180CF
MRHTKLYIYSLAVFILLIQACSSDDGGEGVSEFDRQAMLENIGTNLIVPAYEELDMETGALSTAIDAFVADPTVSNLMAARTAWESAFTAWQYAAPYNFGPADTNVGMLSVLIATWPVDVSLVEQKITSGDLAMNTLDRDTRGFLTAEYLLFGNGKDEATVVADFSGAENDNRRKYLVAVVDDIDTRVNEVDAGWDTYLSSFISNDGTSPGSSVSLLFNEFNRYFELVKNFKIGLPAGTRPGQEAPAPGTTEAYYSKQSLQYAFYSLEAVENIWYGRGANGTDAVGFEEYLASVPGGPELAQDTKASWSNLLATMNAIPSQQPLSESVVSNQQAVADAYTALQQHTRYFKSDLSSRLGISITYSSGDGD